MFTYYYPGLSVGRYYEVWSAASFIWLSVLLILDPGKTCSQGEKSAPGEGGSFMFIMASCSSFPSFSYEEKLPYAS